MRESTGYSDVMNVNTSAATRPAVMTSMNSMTLGADTLAHISINAINSVIVVSITQLVINSIFMLLDRYYTLHY